MQTTRGQIGRLVIAAGLLTLLATTGQAADLKSGVHGMAWASDIAQHPHLSLVRTAGPVSYYINRNMAYQAASQPVPGVIYGFYQDRLFAVYIKLRSPDQAYYLEKRFRAQYGPARVTTTVAGDETVYRWKDQDLKIKLKIRESDRDIKLGIYYRPLSNALNQAQAEELPPDTFRPEPPGAKPDGLPPLL